MPADPPTSAISHVSLGTNNFKRAVEFYDALMPTIGCYPIMDHGEARAYGRGFPEFWIQTPIDGHRATVGNGTHVSFLAANTADVDLFYETGIAQGGVCAGRPGLRPDYGKGYYGCFLKDLDGHKIEAMYFDPDA